MSSAAPPSSQAPVTAPVTTAEASPTPPPTSAAPVSTSAAPATTPTTAAASSTSNPVINSSSSSNPSSDSTSSTSVASSSTASTRSSSSPSASSRASLTSSISFIVQTSNGQVYTQTSVITVPAFTPQETQGNQSSTGFFHNTGAVAGVFSVVGIVGLVVIFFLLTSLIRRRRARKLDREIDEAAAAAANAQAPDFDDFDYTSGTGVGYGQYSETSHGTYNQPPLSHERSRNNLGDIPPTLDPYNNMGGPGAAGIGARGRSLRGGGVQDPFGALANPPEQYEMNEARRSWNQGTLHGGTEVTTYDLLQAAGLSGSDPYAVTRGASTRLAHTPSHSGVSGLTRGQSKATSSSLPTTAENYPMATPAPAYPGGQDRPYPPEKARYSGSYVPAGGYSTMPSGGDTDVYGGYQDQPSAQLDNPHSPGVVGPRAGEGEHEEEYEPGPYQIGRDDPARASLADDEDYGYNIGNRVLRVANE